MVNGWVNNIKESEYYIDPDGISGYMNTDQDIWDQIQYMKATAIGPFHDNVIGLDLIKDPKDDIEKLQIEQFEEDEEGCPDNKISHFLVSYIETVEIIH